jgi:outer membrane receptor for Fe3+-dicitrate
MRADRFFSIASAAAAAVVMASSSQAAELEEVVITAQKREQSLDDVPIAVSAISGDQMRANLVTDIFDLRGTIPALEIRGVDPPSQGTSFAIRGLGTSVFNMGFEPSVSTFVDGVYRSRSGLVASNDLLDIERIEVLKGPQGTLFGKNTTGGVVHIITKAPNLEEFEGEVGVSYEEYNRARLNAILNVPLTGSRSAASCSGNRAIVFGCACRVITASSMRNAAFRRVIRMTCARVPSMDRSLHQLDRRSWIRPTSMDSSWPITSTRNSMSRTSGSRRRSSGKSAI